eukprot:2256703-Pleurochrysis_carterae.AAC.1
MRPQTHQPLGVSCCQSCRGCVAMERGRCPGPMCAPWPSLGPFGIQQRPNWLSGRLHCQSANWPSSSEWGWRSCRCAVTAGARRA